MIRVEHKRSRLAESLEGLGQNLERLDEAHDEALGVIEAQNAELNLDLDHADTVVTKESHRIAVGSRHASYAKLLTMDGSEVADVYIRKATKE